jgi:hypothetical protein
MSRRRWTPRSALLGCAALALFATAWQQPIEAEATELPAGASITPKDSGNPTTDHPSALRSSDRVRGSRRRGIRVRKIKLPAGVSIIPNLNSVGFTTNDKRIYTNVEIEGVEGRHIATLRRDGSRFRCLTCDDLASPDLDLRQPAMTPDGRGFAVRSGNDVQRHSIVECTPSVLKCESAELVPVILPLGAVPLLRNARLEVAPDGKHALFSHVRASGVIVPILGQLVREPDRYTVTKARALAGFRPTLRGPKNSLKLAEGNWGEAKGFTDGGKSLLYYTTIDSLNFDSVKLDLATGEITRLTSDPEYDEDVDVFEGRRGRGKRAHRVRARVAQASFRNHERLRIFSLVPRPPVVDAALRGPIALLRNQAGRRFFDMWVLPVGQAARDSKIAKQIKTKNKPDDRNFNSRGQNRWNGDGTEFVFTEEDANALGTARLMLAKFRGRKPARPIRMVPTPKPTWAPPVSTVLSPDEHRTGTMRGAESGRAEIVFDLKLAPPGAVDIEVEYVGYSDDGCSFLNGTETATVDGFSWTWTADLKVTGCHRGRLTADTAGTALIPATTATGTAVAKYDGARAEGLPAPPFGSSAP